MYQYYDLDETSFENLTIAICEKILGLGTQGFAKGKDGGRDAKFIGVANCFPSQSSPWQGVTIIQAKHTKGINKKFSDSDFFSETSQTNTLAKELPKIAKLVKDSELNNYMLFANRKLMGDKEPKIKKYIFDNTGLDVQNIAIFGEDDLNRFLYSYKDIVQLEYLNLTPFMRAPIIRQEELAEVISHFSKVFDLAVKDKEFYPVVRTTFEQKNQLNNMSEEFAKSLKRLYMQYVTQVKEFLEDPQNQKIQQLYQEAVEEFQIRFVLPQRTKLNYFDEIFNELVELLVGRDTILSANVKLTRIMVFYMYWNCDIGLSKDD